MDYSQLDKVRRSTTPLQLDVVESFMGGRLSRREFIQRATVLGLSTGAIGLVLAACSSASPGSGAASAAAEWRSTSAGPSATGSAKTGGTIRLPPSVEGLDPVTMQDLGGYGITAQSFEFLCTLNTKGTDIAPGLALKWTSERRRHRLDVRSPPECQVA